MRVRYAPAAPVAKLDKAPVYETGDCWFESSRVRQPDLRAGRWQSNQGQLEKSIARRSAG